jgi:hypothetical protein
MIYSIRKEFAVALEPKLHTPDSLGARENQRFFPRIELGQRINRFQSWRYSFMPRTILHRVLQSTRMLAGLALIWSASSSFAFGRGAPEIDPGSATSALTLLAGGVLLIKSRWWRKQ